MGERTEVGYQKTDVRKQKKIEIRGQGLEAMGDGGKIKNRCQRAEVRNTKIGNRKRVIRDY
jgi:hypothetical protein